MTTQAEEVQQADPENDDLDIDAAPPEEIEGRQVLLHYPDGTKKSAKVIVNGPTLLIVKIKGNPQTEMIEKSSLEDVTIDESEIVPLTQTSLKPVKASQVKRHLVDRHGLKLSEVNSMSEGEAIIRHDDLHRIHKEDLGHNHNKEED